MNGYTTHKGDTIRHRSGVFDVRLPDPAGTFVVFQTLEAAKAFIDAGHIVSGHKVYDVATQEPTSIKEARLDRAAEEAARKLHEFRMKHSTYFYSTERVDPKTRIVLPRIRNEALEREASRLFEIVRNANKAALDAEHAAKTSATQSPITKEHP